MKAPTTLALAFASLLLLCACAPERSPDELAGTPARPGSPSLLTVNDDPYQGAREQVKGFYSNGRLVNADVLPAEGLGFVKIHRPRNRGYGAFDLVQVLVDASARMQQTFPSVDRIMIGDMSAEHGDNLSGHASHQNGLDADVAFIRADRTEQDPEDTGGFREDFVNKGKLTENFDLPRNWHYAKVLIQTGRVQRLFVNAVVKKGLCSFVSLIGERESQRETLRRLRTIAGHEDHFHVRITCPASSPDCKAQEDVPEDLGC